MTALTDDILERLSAYADGELDAAEARALEAQIEADPELAAALDDMRSTVAVLSSLGDERAPDDFGARVARRIRRRSRGRFFAEEAGRGQRQLTLLFIVLAVLVLAAIAMLAAPGRIAIEWGDGAVEQPAPGGDAAPDEAPVPDPAPAPPSQGSNDRAAPDRAAAVPAAEVRPVAREVSQWAIVDAGDNARAELVALLGAERVADAGPGRWQVTVPVRERDAAVAALDALGAVRRRVVTLDERPSVATITVYAGRPAPDDPFALRSVP